MDISKRRLEIATKIFAVLVRIFVYSAVPLMLTLLSAIHIRYVPTVVGNVCGQNGNELCYESLPRAGFPFAYWVDEGGVSVSGHLSFEDNLSVLAFGADFLVFVLLILFVDILIQRSKRRTLD